MGGAEIKYILMLFEFVKKKVPSPKHQVQSPKPQASSPKSQGIRLGRIFLELETWNLGLGTYLHFHVR
jgi:hypothetical protein